MADTETSTSYDALSAPYLKAAAAQQEAQTKEQQEMLPLEHLVKVASLLGELDPATKRLLQGWLTRYQQQALERLIGKADYGTYGAQMGRNRNVLPWLMQQRQDYEGRLAQAKSAWTKRQASAGPWEPEPAYLTDDPSIPTYMKQRALDWRNQSAPLDELRRQGVEVAPYASGRPYGG